MTAQRIQRRRVKGWRMPDGAVYVGRPTRWGNQFRIGTPLTYPYADLDLVRAHGVVRDAAHAVALFGIYARITSGYENWVRQRLAGKDLCCWCPLDSPCHADILLEIANGGGP